MSVVVAKGFVRDARLNGVREVAFTAASRFAHPKPLFPDDLPFVHYSDSYPGS
jgi:hypothetical protein